MQFNTRTPVLMKNLTIALVGAMTGAGILSLLVMFALLVAVVIHNGSSRNNVSEHGPPTTARQAAAAKEEDSTNNSIVRAVRKYMARRGAPIDIGGPAKLISVSYTGTTVDGEKIFTAMLRANTMTLYVTGYGDEITSYYFVQQ